MTKCWQENPDERPIFTELGNELKEMENQHKVLSWGIDFQLSKFIISDLRAPGKFNMSVVIG